YLFNIAYVYYHLHNYQEGLKYLLLANKYPADKHWIRQQVYNTTGLIYTEFGKFDSAFIYYRKTLDIAKQNGDTPWIGIAYGNIGDIYMKLKNYDTALQFFEKNYQ